MGVSRKLIAGAVIGAIVVIGVIPAGAEPVRQHSAQAGGPRGRMTQRPDVAIAQSLALPGADMAQTVAVDITNPRYAYISSPGRRRIGRMR